jgi:hypothetical protein
MVFLNPLVLLGLAAAAIPLILHLLNLRKLRTIEFSTLTFLKELQQTKIRRLKLRQLLLLLIRTLLIVLIVLAFARPALHGTMFGGFGSQANSTIVFILDDSFSMAASDERGELFKQAKDAMARLLELLKEGDEAFLIRLSDLPKASVDPATHDFAALKSTVDESQVSAVRRPMSEALRVAGRLLRLSKNVNKEVYVVSDMQRTLFLQKSGEAKSAADSAFDPRVKFFLVELGSKPVSNVAIDSIEIRTQIFEREKPVRISVSASNFGAVAIHDYVTSVYLDGNRAAQGSLSAAAWGSASKEFSATPKRAGFIKGFAELESDVLEPDNRRFFTLYVPERIEVAMVANAPADTRFITLATEAGKSGENRTLLDIQQSTMQRFPFLNIENANVLLLSNVPSFSPGDADRIARFVKRGGGLILFPGSDIQSESYNTVLLRALNIPPFEGISRADAQGSLSFQNVDLDHPLFATIFEPQDQSKRPGAGRIESPSITTFIRRQTGKQGRTLISLTDGSAFLSEYKIGEGRVLVFSVAPSLAWSDFPVKGLFAPLVYRSMIYLSSLGEAVPSFTVGEEPVVSAKRPQSDGGRYTLVAPDGTAELIRPAGQSEGISSSALSFKLNRLPAPGFYEIRGGTAPLTVFAMNVDPRESDPRKVSADELAKFLKNAAINPAAVRTIAPTDDLQSTVLQLRFGIELWKHCLALALALALLEMAVARDARSSRQSAPALS